MKRFASVTFDGVLAACERDVATRTLGSLGVVVTSWETAAGRTYASASLEPRTDLERARSAIGARIDEPALVVLRVVPRFPDRLAAIEEALAGPGRPHGVRDVRRADHALVLELDARVTSPLVALALIDVESGGRALRRIEPLVVLDDTTLAMFAGAALREPDLDASRLIETYLEPLLAGEIA